MTDAGLIKLDNPAKRMLMGYIPLKKARDALLEEIRDSYSSLFGKPVQYDSIHVQTSVEDRMGDSIIRAMETKERLDENIRMLDEKIEQIMSYVRALPDEDCQAVIILRYIRGYSWVKIGHELNYEERWMFVLHGRALAFINASMRGKEKKI